MRNGDLTWKKATPARLEAPYRAAREIRKDKEEDVTTTTRSSAGALRRKAVVEPAWIHLFDRHGRFIRGRRVDADWLRVVESNVVFRGALLQKHDYVSWRVAGKVRNGETVLAPGDLLRMSKLFEEGREWSSEEEPAMSEVAFEEGPMDPDLFEIPDDPGWDGIGPHGPRKTAA